MELDFLVTTTKVTCNKMIIFPLTILVVVFKKNIATLVRVIGWALKKRRLRMMPNMQVYTREHQQCAMDIVLKMKGDVAKNHNMCVFLY